MRSVIRSNSSSTFTIITLKPVVFLASSTLAAGKYNGVVGMCGFQGTVDLARLQQHHRR